MKDSKEYSQKIHKLHRELRRKYPKVEKVGYEDLLDALVYAIVSEDISVSAAQSAIKRFADYFVDWNDLRVSRTEEIIEALGEDTLATRETALVLTGALRAVFEKYNTLSLEALEKMGKRPARQTLEKMASVSRFVVNYCILTVLGGHAIPLTKKMVEYLRANQLVHPEADEQEIEGFLARQIPAQKAYEFYGLLRRESEGRRTRKKKKTTSKRKTKRKAKKKTKKVKKER